MTTMTDSFKFHYTIERIELKKIKQQNDNYEN